MNPAMLAFTVLILPFSQPQSWTGNIRGTVTSKSTGERIVHARVSLDPSPYETYTDSNGVYRLAQIPAGVYSLTLSAPGYARLIFRQLIIAQYAPLVLDAKLGDSASSSDSVVVVKLSVSSGDRRVMNDKMKFYRPDSTIDYKIRIVNPQTPVRGNRSFSIPDSLLNHK